ncbi:hypothetical protein BN946_scf185004.g34 [Trametes cinnabarina]|uniref:Fungal-type protein kinase domain-containing protein n=1 Tax=Pycnoporus cinnabarinus TaxID=5643 RepID=A0A060SRQ1_PYCCI|nr:hypothetical protein BN946_scf185004.g34 [Trametes cinnabarina]
MANIDPFPLSESPIRHSAPPGLAETTPQRFDKLSNFDPRKHGDQLKHIAAIDRPLLGASSMGHTILVDFPTLEKDILRLKTGVVETAQIPDAIVNNARLELRAFFHSKIPPTEDAIAKNLISILNKKDFGGVCKRHTTAFTGNKYEDEAIKSKVDAGLYPNDHKPTDGTPDWTHVRLFIEFKRRGTSLDPFDDHDTETPEATAKSRKAVRNQLTNYALVIRNQQHRTCLYSLFVIGPEFRVMRWDQAGIIVTKKENYAEDPRLLLSFLAWFDSLDDERQGLDPTARLLTKNSRAYKLMDDYALKDPSDMPYKEGSSVPATYMAPRLGPCSPDLKHSVPAYNTRSQAKSAAAIELEDESYLDAVEPDGGDPRVFEYIREQFSESLEHDWPRYRLEVGPEKRIFLVGKPIWVSFWMFGRGTRGYVALDVKTRRFVFLKDSWRPFYVGVEPEGHYLELFASNQHDVPNLRVPAVVVHGDVAVRGKCQVTLTPLFARHRVAVAKKAIREAARESDTSLIAPTGQRDSRGAKHERSSDAEGLEDSTRRFDRDDRDAQDDQDTSYRHYTHYRIVVQDVCLPFTKIRSSKQLVRLTRDCIATHSLAYVKHGLLHRDVSAGNVIIRISLSATVNENGSRKVEWHGVLTDWELAKAVQAQEANREAQEQTMAAMPRQWPRQPERTVRGTWQFMSVAYVQHHPRWPVSVADELESFFHVMLFYSLRLLRHNINDVAAFVVEYFDGFTNEVNVGRRSSSVKREAMYNGIIHTSAGSKLGFTCEDDDPHYELDYIFDGLLHYFKARYAVIKENLRQEEMSQKAGKGRRPPPPIPGPFNQPLLTEDMEAQAKQLNTHDLVLRILDNALDSEREPAPYWPEEDVVPDRLPDSYDPRRLVIALNEMYTATAMATANHDPDGAPARKKARTDLSEPATVPSLSTDNGDGVAHSVDVLAVSFAPGRKGKGKGRALD